MDWSSESLYNKAKVFASRAHREQLESALFGFWMSLSLEVLARSALAFIHPALLADPKEPDNLQYAFGVVPKGVPKSIQAKTVWARCSIFVPDFTDKMSGLCLVISDRRNAELHSGAAAFEGIDNSKWLPGTYEIIDLVLRHLRRDLFDFLGDHAEYAEKVLLDRRDSIKKDVQQKLAAARKYLATLQPAQLADLSPRIASELSTWRKSNILRRIAKCPACNNDAGMSGETVGRSPARLDEDSGVITREIRVLPNKLECPTCKLVLDGFQELNEAGSGAGYTIESEENPIEFFGIVPEEYIDVESLVQERLERMGEDFAYLNE